MDPHTTQKEGRSCKECHTDPRALGLGRGTLWREGTEWRFQSAFSPAPDLLELDHALDSFVDVNGTSLVNFSRPWLRTFNRKEIEAVLRVGLCVDCHHRYDDPVIRRWGPPVWKNPCPKGRAAMTPHSTP